MVKMSDILKKVQATEKDIQNKDPPAGPARDSSRSGLHKPKSTEEFKSQ